MSDRAGRQRPWPDLLDAWLTPRRFSLCGSAFVVRCVRITLRAAVFVEHGADLRRGRRCMNRDFAFACRRVSAVLEEDARKRHHHRTGPRGSAGSGRAIARRRGVDPAACRARSGRRRALAGARRPPGFWPAPPDAAASRRPSCKRSGRRRDREVASPSWQRTLAAPAACRPADAAPFRRRDRRRRPWLRCRAAARPIHIEGLRRHGAAMVFRPRHVGERASDRAQVLVRSVCAGRGKSRSRSIRLPRLLVGNQQCRVPADGPRA